MIKRGSKKKLPARGVFVSDQRTALKKQDMPLDLKPPGRQKLLYNKLRFCGSIQVVIAPLRSPSVPGGIPSQVGGNIGCTERRRLPSPNGKTTQNTPSTTVVCGSAVDTKRRFCS
jgi:hypothetical protein